MDLDALTAADLPVRIGRYELQELLGHGGFARVFGADLLGPGGFRKPVALKVLGPHRLADRDVLIAEARLGARLRHPNVVEVYDLGEMEGRAYIAMQRVDGFTLRDLLSSGPLPPRAAVDVVAQVARGAHHAHELRVDGRHLGVVHRDIKPSNVLIDRDGRAGLADFGIARAGDDVPLGAQAGPPGYMAPEQIRGEPLDRRADVFALGTVLATAALGRRPWPCKPWADYARRMRDPVAQLDRRELDGVLPGLGDVVARCVAASPHDRFPTAAALADVLERLGPTRLASVGQAPPTPAPEPPTFVPYSPPPTNLVAPTDAFVGRDPELADLLARIGRPGLVSVLGPGGIGKTRLAREVAWQSLERWPGGAWFVDLSAARDADGVVQAVATALRVDAVDLDAGVGHALRHREDALLVLDNFEQVAAHASLVAGWLAAASRVRVLVTSRERLRVDGEQVMVLGPLGGAAAVDLFVQRGRRALPAFDPDAEELGAIASLVEALDRLPLAIELAASRLPLLPVRRLDQVLRNRLDRLRSDRRDVPARQATLRGAVDWSWDLLEPWQQAAFAQLSVFEGSFTVDAACAVLDLDPWPDAPWGLFALEALLDRSLVRVAETEPETRLALFVQLREYAAEKLAAMGDLAAVGRHAAWFAQGRARRAADLPDLVAAVERADARGDADTAVAALVAATRVVERHGPFPVGLRLVGAVRAERPEHRLTIALLRASLRLEMGIDDDAADAVALAEALGRPVELSQALGMRTRSLWMRGDMEGARVAVECAIQLAREAGAPSQEASSHVRAVHVALAQGRSPDAHAHARRAIAIYEQLGAAEDVASAWGQLGIVLAQEGRLAEADAWMSRAIAAPAASPRDRSMAMNNIVHVLLRQGRIDEAERTLHRVIADAEAAGNARAAAAAALNLAVVWRNQGRIDEALAMHHELMENAGPDRVLWGMAGANVAALLHDRGELDAGIAMFREVLEVTRAQNQTRLLAHALSGLARLHLAKDELDLATTAVEEGLPVALEACLDGIAADLHETRAIIAGHRGMAAHAEADMARADRLGDPMPLSVVSRALARGEIALSLGDREAAERALAHADEVLRRAGAGDADRMSRLVEALRRRIPPSEG